MKQQKDREKINLRNEFAKEDYTKDQIEIQMSSTTKDLYFSHLFKYSAKIQNEIQIKEIKQMVNNQISILQQTTQIQEKNIILFIRLLNEEDVEISINEYLDLYKLAKFFQVKTLEKYLSKFVLNHLNDIEFIVDIINEISNSNSEDILMNVIDSSQLEQSLIGKINDCLKSEKFRTLQISQISRIIQKCSKESIDNNLLYEFIKQNKKERFVLFSFLSIENLNETNLKEILSKHDDNEEKKYYEYLPSNLKFIKMLKEKEDSLNEKIQNLENQMQQIVQKNKDFENQLESIKDENAQLKMLVKNQKENEETDENQLKNIKEENEKLKEKIKVMIENEKKKIENLIFKEIPYQKDFEGIFDFLRKSSNILDEVKVTCPKKSDNNPKSVIFNNNTSLFGVRDPTSQWICFEFKKFNVILESYTIRSYKGSVYHPKSWIIEGSEDFNLWDKIDEQKDCNYMKGRTDSNNHVHTFIVQNQNHKPFKFIKITQTDKNWGNNTNFIINCIELYGSLVNC